MFRGIAALNLDAKGRLSLPMRYRERLQEVSEGKLVITIDIDETCLLLYPATKWDVIERKIDALPSFNPASRRIQRLLIGHACDIELDNQGRVLLPSLLREYAQLLDKEVVLVGQGKKFELWDGKHWQNRREMWLHPTDDNDDDDQWPSQLQQLSL